MLLSLKQLRRLIEAVYITVLLAITITIALLQVFALHVAVAFKLPFPVATVSCFKCVRDAVSVLLSINTVHIHGPQAGRMSYWFLRRT